jgi:hypothetical protein
MREHDAAIKKLVTTAEAAAQVYRDLLEALKAFGVDNANILATHFGEQEAAPPSQPKTGPS